MEADDVVGEQAAVDRLAPASREDPPRVRLRPGDVDEVLEEGVGPRRADDRGRRVQVVVVEHHQRLLARLDRPQDRLGDVVVDHRVAGVPGVGLLLADVGGVGEVPEVVLDEPQDRVRDHVVEAVVGLGLGLDHEHVVGDTVELDPDRGTLALARDLDVLVGHRGGDPERPAVSDQARERGHQAAAAALDLPFAVGSALELRRAPVRRRSRDAGRTYQLSIPGSGAELGEEVEPVAQQARRQEVLAGVLLARPPEPLRELGILEDLDRAHAPRRPSESTR